MIDDVFTKKIVGWLEIENPTIDQLKDGAMMMLKLNRNQTLYNTIMRRPEKYVEKIRYELRKRLPMRLDHMTRTDVANLEKEIMPPIEEEMVKSDDKPAEDEQKNDDLDDKAVAAGRRADHDSLPEDIRTLWDSNVERWKKIKELYNTCKSLDKPCDRYEYLKILKDEWYTYKKNYEVYDTYKLDDNAALKSDSVQTEISFKDITNARAYISKNIDKLETLSKPENAEKYHALFVKIRERVDVILKAGEEFSQEMQEKLSKIYDDLSFNEENINDTKAAES